MPDSRFETPEEAPAEPGADSGETPNQPPAERKHRSEFGHGKCADQRIHPSQHPDGKDRAVASKMARNLARCAQDAGGDRIADDDSDTETYTKNA